MTQALPMAGAPAQVNPAGLTKNDYRGSPSTLCQGCGHNSISNQIISALYEMNIVPEDVVKFSGIGCSSKSPDLLPEPLLRLQRPARAHAAGRHRRAVRRLIG